MSELKELSWEVQESVQPLPFEELERRGVRRRRRRQALTGTGIVAVVAIAVLATVLPLNNLLGTEKAPAANTPGIAVDQAAEDLLHADPRLQRISFATPTRWAAAWESFYAGKSAFTAVLSRDGVRTTAPVRERPYGVVQVGGETLALSMPKEADGFRQDDPTWPQTRLVRLTDQGKIDKPLRWAPPASRIGAGEVLVSGSHTVMVLNLNTGTLAKLAISGAQETMNPIRDNTGRWWLRSMSLDAPGQIYWTDNGGKSWQHTAFDPTSPGGHLGVSPNGRTIVFYPFGDEDTVVAVRMSTDRGKTWQTVANRTSPYLSDPIAFDDGTGLLLYQFRDQREFLWLGAGEPTTPPADLTELAGGDGVVYGMLFHGSDRNTKTSISTDRGKTWKTFEPR